MNDRDDIHETPGGPDKSLSPRRMLEEIHRDCRILRRDQRTMWECVYGPQNRPGEGLLSQVGELKKSEAKRNWWTRAALLAAVTAIAGMIQGWFTGGTGHGAAP